MGKAAFNQLLKWGFIFHSSGKKLTVPCLGERPARTNRCCFSARPGHFASCKGKTFLLFFKLNLLKLHLGAAGAQRACGSTSSSVPQTGSREMWFFSLLT